MTRLVLLIIITATSCYAQDTQSSKAKPERTAQEQKGYDDAMREVDQAKQKAEADRVKAEHEAEAHRRSTFVTYSAVDVAAQELMQESGKPAVKESKKLLLKKQKLLAEVRAIDDKLHGLEQRVVTVAKVKSD